MDPNGPFTRPTFGRVANALHVLFASLKNTPGNNMLEVDKGPLDDHVPNTKQLLNSTSMIASRSVYMYRSKALFPEVESSHTPNAHFPRRTHRTIRTPGSRPTSGLPDWSSQAQTAGL